MDRLSSEILLSIFKKLCSVEMVRVMPVCRKWLEIIDDNKSLWRRLVLPWKENGWKPSVLILFDHKCQSTLKEVSMEVKELDCEDVGAFREILEKSKDTLEIINIFNERWLLRRRLSPAFANFLAAKEFRVVDSRSSRVQLVQSPIIQEKVATDHSSQLKILEIFTIDFLPKSYSDLTANLSSLSLEEKLPSSKWREILAGPSKTLKHLRMSVTSEHSRKLEPTLLLFPKLQSLEFSSLAVAAVQLPRWMSAPQLSSLITNSSFTSLISTSSVSLLWIDGDQSRVQETFPKLSQLIYQPSEVNATLLRPVIQMLIQRSQNAAAKMDVDGVEMRQIQKLVIPFKYFNDRNHSPLLVSMISHLKSMVDEVVAFESEPRIIKVEI